jgi:ferrous iron transport protein A
MMVACIPGFVIMANSAENPLTVMFVWTNLCMEDIGEHAKMTRTMDQLTIGQCARIDAIRAPKQLKRRLMDMGFTKGVNVSVVKMAPMGDPMEVQLRGYNLCLRKAEASVIELR